jgi:hypothetical protein
MKRFCDQPATDPREWQQQHRLPVEGLQEVAPGVEGIEGIEFIFHSGDPVTSFSRVTKMLHVNVAALVISKKVRDGQRKAIREQWGDPKERLRKVQQFLKEHRKSYPRLGVNGMILAVVKACGVSRSYVQEQRRLGRLIIPAKQI